MNVPLRLRSPQLDGCVSRARPRRRASPILKVTALVGGMRASLYNAMPLAGVEALTAFMKEFERRHG
jgi:phosphoserine aminotransferase